MEIACRLVVSHACSLRPCGRSPTTMSARPAGRGGQRLGACGGPPRRRSSATCSGRRLSLATRPRCSERTTGSPRRGQALGEHRRRSARGTPGPRAGSSRPAGWRRARRCRRTSPAAYSPGIVVRPDEVGAHAAGRVVLRRGDRDQVVRRVDAVPAAGLEDRREPRLPRRSPRARASSHTCARALLAHPAHDRLGHDVARGEVGQRVLALHEPHAVVVDAGRRPRRAPPRRPAAAGPVESGPRYMTVGWNCTNSRSATSAPARSASAMPSPVATDGVRGLREDLAEPAGGEDDGRGEHGADPVVLALADDVQREPLDAARGRRRAGRGPGRAR